MDVESKFGQMVQDMMVSGKMAWPTDMEDLSMLKEMSTRESGLMTRPMDMESTPTLTEVDTRDNGSKINNTDSEWNSGQMVPNMRVITNKE